MSRRRGVRAQGAVGAAVTVQSPGLSLLQPVEDAAAALEAAHAGLASADWVETVKGLNLLRQLTAHHADACSGQL